LIKNIVLCYQDQLNICLVPVFRNQDFFSSLKLMWMIFIIKEVLARREG